MHFHLLLTPKELIYLLAMCIWRTSYYCVFHFSDLQHEFCRN